MSGLGNGWSAGILAATFITIGLGCGGDASSPPPTTLVSTSTIATSPPSTARAVPPSTVPNAAAAPSKPRTLPVVDVTQGADLVSVSNVRWKDDEKRQVATDVRLLKGPIASFSYAFQAPTGLIGSGLLPGNAFSATDGVVTIYLPASVGKTADGKEQFPDISTADRLVIHVFGLPADAVAPGQPAWTAPLVTACEQGSATDCQTLAAAYRTGASEQGKVTPDAALAERFSKRFVETGRRNCAMGAPENCFVLGRAYLTGEDVPKDPDMGVALVQKACAAGVEAACSLQAQNPAFQAQPR